jgi:hypothetical protein
MQHDIDERKYNQKRFFHVFIMPASLSVFICFISYLLTDIYHLDKSYKSYGYLTGICIGLIFYRNKRENWQPYADSWNVRTNGLNDDGNNYITTEPGQHSTEPPYYEAAFYFSTAIKIFLVIFGLAGICINFYFYPVADIMRSVLWIIGSVFSLGFGIKEIINKSPKLKIAKEGLWTKKLGFMPWETIEKAGVTTEKNWRSSNTYLEIYLSDSDTKPQQKLWLDYIRGYKKIQPLIDKLCRQ